MMNCGEWVVNSWIVNDAGESGGLRGKVNGELNDGE